MRCCCEICRHRHIDCGKQSSISPPPHSRRVRSGATTRRQRAALRWPQRRRRRCRWRPAAGVWCATATMAVRVGLFGDTHSPRVCLLPADDELILCDVRFVCMCAMCVCDDDDGNGVGCLHRSATRVSHCLGGTKAAFELASDRGAYAICHVAYHFACNLTRSHAFPADTSSHQSAICSDLQRHAVCVCRRHQHAPLRLRSARVAAISPRTESE